MSEAAASSGPGEVLAAQPMNFSTLLIRLAALAGVASSVFWMSAVAWAVVRGPPPLLAVMTTAALATAVVVFAGRRVWSRSLLVSDETDFSRLLLRFTTAAIVTYVLFWAFIIGAGTAALWLLPPPAGSEAGIGVAILAWWAPIWTVRIEGWAPRLRISSGCS